MLSRSQSVTKQEKIKMQSSIAKKRFADYQRVLNEKFDTEEKAERQKAINTGLAADHPFVICYDRLMAKVERLKKELNEIVAAD